MRFTNHPKHEIEAHITRGVTPRRLTAAKKALKRERDKLPLFRELIRAEQPTPEERIRFYDEVAERDRQARRDFTASQWREARRMLRAMSRADQEELLHYWNHYWSGPTKSEYFADLVDNWTRGTREEIRENKLYCQACRNLHAKGIKPNKETIQMGIAKINKNAVTGDLVVKRQH